MRAFKKLAAVAATLVITAVGLLVAPSPASAAYGCSGSVIDSYAVGTLGKVYLYYSSADGGTNCAATVATTGTSVKKEMYIRIAKCTQTSPGSVCNIPGGWDDVDSGNFYEYAGPASVTGTANNCIFVFGAINYNGNYASGGSKGATHC
jgi:FlaG/FlaF family flagellin (archaellin)